MPAKIKCLASAPLIFLAIAAGHLAAQNLVIANAHIVDGNGGVIQKGSVVVRDGRIVSVSDGAVNAAGARIIDAKGMTVMPGFIDDHRHVIADSFPPPNPVQWMKDQAVP